MRRVDSWVRPEGLNAALFAIATTLMLQSTRAFVSYLVFVVDQSHRTAIATVAIVVFAFPVVTWLLARAVGTSRLLAAAVLLLAVSRFGLQVLEQPSVRLVTSGLTVITWGLMTVLMVAAHRRSVAVGLILGFGLDLALRTARGSLDILWMPGLAQTAAVDRSRRAPRLALVGYARSIARDGSQLALRGRANHHRSGNRIVPPRHWQYCLRFDTHGAIRQRVKWAACECHDTWRPDCGSASARDQHGGRWWNTGRALHPLRHGHRCCGIEFCLERRGVGPAGRLHLNANGDGACAFRPRRE